MIYYAKKFLIKSLDLVHKYVHTYIHTYGYTYIYIKYQSIHQTFKDSLRFKKNSRKHQNIYSK